MDAKKTSKDFDDEEPELEKVQFKIILLGDGAVGKSSITMRFAEDQFEKVYKQTVGCDFFIRRLDVPPRHQVSLQIWLVRTHNIRLINSMMVVILCI